VCWPRPLSVVCSIPTAYLETLYLAMYIPPMAEPPIPEETKSNAEQC
jgi:hypothetical protein